jgi:hypothetical protein
MKVHSQLRSQSTILPINEHKKVKLQSLSHPGAEFLRGEDGGLGSDDPHLTPCSKSPIAVTSSKEIHGWIHGSSAVDPNWIHAAVHPSYTNVFRRK